MDSTQSFYFLYEDYQGFYSLQSSGDSDLDKDVCLYELEPHEVQQRIHLGLLAVLIAVGNKGPYFRFTQNRFHLWLDRYRSDQGIASNRFGRDSI